MRVYVYQASLLCEPCGDAVKAAHTPPHGYDPANEHTWDSDDYPKGPYADGGGEADTPQTCDHCDIFLENPLTPDGVAYVRQALAENACRPEFLKEWRDFYALPPTEV